MIKSVAAGHKRPRKFKVVPTSRINSYCEFTMREGGATNYIASRRYAAAESVFWGTVFRTGHVKTRGSRLH